MDDDRTPVEQDKICDKKHSVLTNWLEVRESALEGAGLGLFAAGDFPDGTLVGLHVGDSELVDDSKCDVQWKFGKVHWHSFNNPESMNGLHMKTMGLKMMNNPNWNKKRGKKKSSIKHSGLTHSFIDNVAALHMINEKRPAPRAWHIDIQHFAIQEWCKKKDLTMEHLPGTLNPSDANHSMGHRENKASLLSHLPSTRMDTHKAGEGHGAQFKGDCQSRGVQNLGLVKECPGSDRT